MRKYQNIIIGICCVIIFLSKTSCIKKYDSGVNVPAKGYLVVEGYINSDGGSTTIYLSRAQALSDTAKVVRERKAQVSIEGDNNTSYPLTETNPGLYISAPVSLNKSSHYRIHIKTSTVQEYNSDYSSVRSTPAIDSVFWTRDNSRGVSFYVNTHDAQNSTRYYMWKWNETWEYHAPIQSNMKFTFGPGGFISKAVFTYTNQITDSSLYVCYHNDSSTNIVISSSEKLEQDVIQSAPLELVIPPGNEKLSVLFSLNVKEYAISKNAYQFYQLMKKNTEHLGSIFDAQPSQVTGNVHSVSDSTEKVIGFVEVSQEVQKRIFVSITDVPNWGYSNECIFPGKESSNDSTRLNNIVETFHTPLGIISTSFLPTGPDYMFGFNPSTGLPNVVKLGDIYCVDCKLKGGTILRPPFWP